jgi:hypothetical protein
MTNGAEKLTFDDAICARCGCYRSAHGEDERCEPVGWTFTRTPAPSSDIEEAFTYAYRYPAFPPKGATVIRFGTGGCEINGSKPIEAIPLYTADTLLAIQGERATLTRQLRDLAVILHGKHYPEVTQWEPLDDPLGILSQIDNMTTGMVRAALTATG